jgi:hypothetical protein
MGNLNKPVKVGILELQRHVPIIYTFAKIFKMKDTKVTIFTTKELYLRLKAYLKDEKNFYIILKEDDESNRNFIKRVKKICDRKIDLLFVNTIHETLLDLICYLDFSNNFKKVLLIHHVNAWLKPYIVFDLLHPIKTIDTNLSSALIKGFILPKFDAINVIYHPLKNYIRKNTNYNGEIFTLPTSIYENNKNIQRSSDIDKLYIVIPGLIQRHRKNYEPVISAFEKLFQKYKDKIKLFIPGLPVGKFGFSIYKKFEEMKNKGYDIKIFDHFVPDKVFNDILSKSDIIIAPIRVDTRADGNIKEIYGKTVGSGIVFNAIQYAKPIITPSNFEILTELSSSNISYSNDVELEKIIENIILKRGELEKLNEQAYQNSKKFALENLQSYFEEIILRWSQIP